ncbi:iron ABC transporter ATP-binding protein [Propionibacterium australiense]|uniref:ABC transporter n=1 Tax=Propionibacterium australiense TaxID=119981 RepID=A0A383S3N0_9ACTN|nr:ATP-binding cassette domain-containing protein [Propionibacterium australiense]RLP11576.1 ATP-binding cassette domain-containing protein [Propionibacterium australiense]RLP12691.1 ATP-binding cassette domain-containing protein [Propionibacterium australiense]SYZ32291.1 ABC transporter [Propionibacterium australiense]VEH90503.1 Probable siderophore transport system ATP-binding protein YusV [Propionibacterium australiense]
MISAKAITKSYGARRVLDSITLDLPAGGVVALVGANGAGKSTFLSVISRLLAADAGSVTVGGLDVTSAHPGRLARTLSVLRQDNHLDVRLTVRDLVAFGRYPHSHGRLTTDDDRIVDEAMDWMDLGELADRYLDEMSGGQRQRAFVAMVLAQQTPYVLLDEPLNNLDMVHSVSMMTTLRAAATELERTIVVVLHDINMAAAWADHVVALRDGALVAQGTPEQIMTRQCLSEVFGMDVPVHEIDGHRIAMVWG